MPVITSTPVMTAVAGSAYSYQVTVTDRDNDSRTYALTTTYTGSGPPSINSSGLVSWTTPVAGAYTFTVTATDAGSLRCRATR